MDMASTSSLANAAPGRLDQSLVQGLVFTGYPELPFASYLVLELLSRPRASTWLKALLPLVTDGRKQARARAVNLAFSHAGLAALGLHGESLNSFPREFAEGMAGTVARSRILGDVGESDPKAWRWGARAGDPRPPSDVHALLLLYAATAQDLERLQTEQVTALAGAARVIYARDGVTLPADREHFGFADGISQPRIAGSETTVRPGLLFVQPGEFILGHHNEYDQLPLSPQVPDGPRARTHLPPGNDELHRDLGANGSYLVVRQLHQDVAGFWNTMLQRSGDEDGQPNEGKAIRLAAKCVGRWPGGAPLSLAAHDDPAEARRNDFSYADDPIGMKCPIGAHVRRANPRDSLEPGPDESARLNRRHMILRRGRAYGPPLPPFASEPAAQERGLFFIAVNANIGRQFEFMQQTWLNNPKFDGLAGETDPISGSRDAAGGGSFSVPEAPVRRRLHGLPAFVTTHGGEYFFLPGLRALAYLAEVGTR